MDIDLRKDIIAFLTPLPCMSTEDARRTTLYAAGLDTILQQTDLSGASRKSVTTIVYALEHHGTVNDELALAVLLRYVATTVGGDKQDQIQDWCEQLLHAPPSPTLQESDSISFGSAGPSGGIQIGTIVGNAQVTQVQGGMQGDLTGRDTYTSPASRRSFLRSQPQIVSKHEAAETFHLDPPYEFWSEHKKATTQVTVAVMEGTALTLKGQYWTAKTFINNQYEDQGGIVLDHATSLMWKKDSVETVSFDSAHRYIERLNHQQFAGYADWRVPTIPELLSLLEPERLANHQHIAPIFEIHAHEWCFSADYVSLSKNQSSFTPWYVCFDDGFISCYVLLIPVLTPSPYFTRAVRSLWTTYTHHEPQRGIT